MNKKLKIGFITCHFPPDSIGGGQLQSLRLSDALGKLFNVDVFVRDYIGDAPREEKLGSFTIIRRKVLSIPVLRSVLDLLNGLVFIGKRRGQYDLFLSFHIQLAALTVVLGKIFFNVKGIVSPRGYEDYSFSPWYKKYFQKFIYKNASAILIQSEEIKKLFIDEAKKVFVRETMDNIQRCIYIFPNIIEVPETGKSNGFIPSRILFVGRLIDYKGVQYLIEAIKKLSVPYELLIIGEGPYRSLLQRSSAGLNISFLGEISPLKVCEFMRSASVFVLPSLTENLPNVILEALAAGVPVIATSVGALPEIIREGENGFLIPPKDSNLIAERLKCLLTDSSLREKMSCAAYKSVKPFTAGIIVPRLEQVLKEIADL
jgi:glycosyltransferase involved in cell wall biosynthesis